MRIINFELDYYFQRMIFIEEDLSSWDVSNVTQMQGVFFQAPNFNQDISDWDVSSALDMHWMFAGARAFNQDIGDWDTSSVQIMNHMFFQTQAFDQDIGDWDVANVTTFKSMFNQSEAFNQDISAWDISSAQDLSKMFHDAESFNQDLGDWDISNVANMEGIFDGSAMSVRNIDATLNGWYEQAQNGDVQSDIEVGIEALYVSEDSLQARQYFENAHGWEFKGGRDVALETEDDSAQMQEDTSLTIAIADLLANDPDSAQARYISSQTNSGTLIEDSQNLTFIPDPDFNGEASITYRIEDGNGDIGEGELIVMVEAMEDAPVAIDDTGRLNSGDVGYFDVIENDYDPDGDALEISIDEVFGGEASVSDNQIVFSAEEGFVGEGEVLYHIHDGHGNSDAARLSLDVSEPEEEDSDSDWDDVFMALSALSALGVLAFMT